MDRIKLTILSVCALIVGALREQFATANVSVETAQGTHGGANTYKVDAALAKTHLLLKAGTDAWHVDICGANDFPVGLNIGEAEAIEDTIAVESLRSGETKLARCATAIAVGVDLYAAAAGLVQGIPAVAGTYYKVGRSKRLAVLESTTNYVIEFEAHYPVRVDLVSGASTAAHIITAMAAPAHVIFI